MFSKSVVITGLGLCTPLGATAGATWDALAAGGFITDHSRAVGDFQGCRVIALAKRAARAAVADAGWSGRDLEDAALVVGTSKGPVEAWMGGEALATVSSGLSAVGDGVAADLRLGFGPRLTISTACASGLHALIRGAMLIEQGYRRVVVVAAESSLHGLFLGSFARLGVLAGAEVGCRPFDEERAGFLVSEAAAAVCLESDGGGPRVERLAMGADATHLTGGDPDGKTLRRLLAEVIDGRAVDLIHGHGTGTVFNDPIELAAIESVVGQGDRPLLYSHKGALGHSLGAAGLISVVINCIAHRRGVVPGNSRTRRPLKMQSVQIERESVRRPIRRSVALASGFGGAAAVVSLIN